MRSFVKEMVIPLGEDKTINSEMRLHVRVEDLGAGPFLVLRGEYDGSEEDVYKPGDFALDSHQEINALAKILCDLLTQSEEVSK